MTIYNFGSINIDYIYRLDHFPAVGETLSAIDYEMALGGKGANQSLAIARAGGNVIHIGAANPQDIGLLDPLIQAGARLRILETPQIKTGHALVMVNQQNGDNQIILYGGSNLNMEMDWLETALADAAAGDWLVLQNETNLTKQALQLGRAKGMNLCYSPAPFVLETCVDLLPLCDLLIVNQGEADAICQAMGKPIFDLSPRHIIVTKGADGVSFRGGDGAVLDLPAPPLEAVDTVGAGDCFLGYVLAGLDLAPLVDAPLVDAPPLDNSDWQAILKRAVAAAGLSVTRKGAGASIPWRREVENI